MNGLSFVVAAGKYGGFYGKADGLGLRLCFGWVAFTLYFMDIEAAIEKMVEELDAQKNDEVLGEGLGKQDDYGCWVMGNDEVDLWPISGKSGKLFFRPDAGFKSKFNEMIHGE